MPRGSFYITLEERERIHALLDQGYGPRQIALELGHAPATIVREMRRSRYLATLASQSPAQGSPSASGPEDGVTDTPDRDHEDERGTGAGAGAATPGGGSDSAADGDVSGQAGASDAPAGSGEGAGREPSGTRSRREGARPRTSDGSGRPAGVGASGRPTGTSREVSRARRWANRRRTRAAWKEFEARQSGLVRPGGAGRERGTDLPATEGEDREAGRASTRWRMAGVPSDQALAAQLRVPGLRDHKYTRGVVGVYAGSRTYPGAAVLVASAAVRAGAGLVRILAPERVEDLVLAARPEVVPADGRCQALVIGPGTDPSDSQRAAELQAAIRRSVNEDIPAVIDAGALPLVAQLLAGRDTAGHGTDAVPELTLSARQVLTPHAGEAAQMLTTLGVKCGRAEVEAGPVAAVTELAQLTGATVVLKGTPTLVAGPVRVPGAPGGGAGVAGERRPGGLGAPAADVAGTAVPGWDARGAEEAGAGRGGTVPADSTGAAVPVHDGDRVRVWALDSGPGWLATAGSGDVLAGVMGTVLAAVQADTERGAADLDEGELNDPAAVLDPVACAALAVRLHALAGWEASWRAGRSAWSEDFGAGERTTVARGAVGLRRMDTVVPGRGTLVGVAEPGSGVGGPEGAGDCEEQDRAGAPGRAGSLSASAHGTDRPVGALAASTDLGGRHEGHTRVGGPFAALDLAEALPVVVAQMLATRS